MSAAPTEADYFTGDADLYRGRTQLCLARDPLRRAALLEREAEINEHRARLHVAVFGDDLPDDDGITPELWLAYSARLLRIVANAERCRASGVWTPCDDPLEEPVAGELHRWARGGYKHGLVFMLCDDWRPLTGGQAVETIYTLPLGWSWLRGALCALDDAWRLRGRT